LAWPPHGGNCGTTPSPTFQASPDPTPATTGPSETISGTAGQTSGSPHLSLQQARLAALHLILRLRPPADPRPAHLVAPARLTDLNRVRGEPGRLQVVLVPREVEAT
jgi:hypothetical protein